MTSIFAECFDPRRRGGWFWCWCEACGWADWHAVVPVQCRRCGCEGAIRAKSEDELHD